MKTLASFGSLVACPDDAAAPARPRFLVSLDHRDLWVGAYVSVDAVYICPLPCLVVRVARGPVYRPMQPMDPWRVPAPDPWSDL